MSLPEGTHLAYVIEHEAWYARDGKRGINVMAKYAEGGIAWEFEVTEELREDKETLDDELVVKLELFADAFAALRQVPKLFGLLTEGISFGEVLAVLKFAGAVDETERKEPSALKLAAPGEGIAAPFVIQYFDGSFAAKSAQEVSYMYDMADCDAMEEVRAIYATDEKGLLAVVRLGEQKRDEGFPEESPVYYASAPLYAGKRLVGYVQFSDH